MVIILEATELNKIWNINRFWHWIYLISGYMNECLKQYTFLLTTYIILCVFIGANILNGILVSVSARGKYKGAVPCPKLTVCLWHSQVPHVSQSEPCIFLKCHISFSFIKLITVFGPNTLLSYGHFLMIVIT